MNQVAQYTPMVQAIVNQTIFGKFHFSNQDFDTFFKKAFMNRFLDREISPQVLDVWRQRLVSLCIVNDQYLSNIYEHFADMFSNHGLNHSETDTTNSKVGTRNNRSAHRSLPQDTAELSLDDDIVQYPDYTDYDKSRDNDDTTGKSVTDSTSDHFSPEVLEKLNNVYEKKLDEFDRKLFIQIW